MCRILFVLSAAFWLVTIASGEELILDVSVERNVKAMLPHGGGGQPGLNGRGGLTARSVQGPQNSGAATLIRGSVDGSLFPNANFGDVLIPGSGYHAFALEPGHLGKSFTLQYDVYLSEGHSVTFMSLTTRFMADLDGNQVIKFDAPKNEFADRIETFSLVKGPNYQLVDQWQTVSTDSAFPETDKGGQPIGQYNMSLNVGHMQAPGGKVWIRNIRLVVHDAAESSEDATEQEDTPAPEPE